MYFHPISKFTSKYSNVFITAFNLLTSLNRKFDLKGSTIEREATDKELRKSSGMVTFKDNDFIKQGIKVKIGAEAKKKLNEILTADVEVRVEV